MHSMKYFFTASSEVTNFPEFVAVGMVDDIQIDYYDSNTKRAEPKQDWMKKVTEDKADFWERLTEISVGHQQNSKGNLDNLKRRFNQTGGVHIVQRMYGCEWDDETGDVNGYEQHGYDGEDFIALDLKTMTWVAAQQQAVTTKQMLDNNTAQLENDNNQLTKDCVDSLKLFVYYGRSSLMRTDLPTVSLLQKTPSSRVTCHATGFYPNRAMMFWRKDGEVLHEDVDNGEILPNHDGSFQISADLQLPSDDWGKYDCVFQISGVKEDIVTKLDKREIKTNYVNPMNPVNPIIAIIAALVLLGLAIIGYKKYRGRKSSCETSPENCFELAEELNPEPK
ncbi:LOW QUALITY PROTEIN: major histocompatibility complex class I-related gene protein-like [Labrus bergylta]|uniref:LOW QUALITY PROTEIN: major histocompatibility complex class I-related gene protein-like n=1 Tax=Labrus bergylta TaxID=56723 RepID=UPI00331411C1